MEIVDDGVVYFGSDSVGEIFGQCGECASGGSRIHGGVASGSWTVKLKVWMLNYIQFSNVESAGIHYRKPAERAVHDP